MFSWDDYPKKRKKTDWDKIFEKVFMVGTEYGYLLEYARNVPICNFVEVRKKIRDISKKETVDILVSQYLRYVFKLAIKIYEYFPDNLDRYIEDYLDNLCMAANEWTAEDGNFLTYYNSKVHYNFLRHKTQYDRKHNNLDKEYDLEEIDENNILSLDCLEEYVSRNDIWLYDYGAIKEKKKVEEYIIDRNPINGYDYIYRDFLRECVDILLDDLKEREKQVIILRFGFQDDQPKTLDEVGRVFDVNRERVRQIEAKALRKLKNPVRSKKLRGFTDYGVIEDKSTKIISGNDIFFFVDDNSREILLKDEINVNALLIIQENSDFLMFRKKGDKIWRLFPSILETDGIEYIKDILECSIVESGIRLMGTLKLFMACSLDIKLLYRSFCRLYRIKICECHMDYNIDKKYEFDYYSNIKTRGEEIETVAEEIFSLCLDL